MSYQMSNHNELGTVRQHPLPGLGGTCETHAQEGLAPLTSGTGQRVYHQDLRINQYAATQSQAIPQNAAFVNRDHTNPFSAQAVRASAPPTPPPYSSKAPGFEDIGRRHDPNRRLLDWPADVRYLARHLDLKRYSVLGGSGGGPHALACAYAIPPDELSSVGLLCSAAPWEAGTRDVLWSARLGSWASTYCPSLTTRLLDLVLGMSKRLMASDTGKKLIDGIAAKEAATAGKEIPESEKHPEADAARRERLLRIFLEPFAQGSRGFVQEAYILTHPYGFRLDVQFERKVKIWHGTKDVNSPIRMVRSKSATGPNRRRVSHILLRYTKILQFTLVLRIQDRLESHEKMADTSGTSRLPATLPVLLATLLATSPTTTKSVAIYGERTWGSYLLDRRYCAAVSSSDGEGRCYAEEAGALSDSGTSPSGEAPLIADPPRPLILEEHGLRDGGRRAARPNVSLLAGHMAEAGWTESQSFGMHVGSAATRARVPGFLYFGGYDRHRVHPRRRRGAHLPVTNDSDLGLYLWDTGDEAYARVVDSAAALRFTFHDRDHNARRVDISVPFTHPNLTLDRLLIGGGTKPYFSRHAASNGYYSLGRAFPQDAFFGANFEKSTY
ncbi:hypothetical protein DL762_008829 [Monosporascus cannonballus]|uniref:AB hydrolase-1 domain-containing protein n=1 Tax=Monosporascus cannonballus TaxID=155416 RepID=A0ABY0GVC7_9PEZI|nr:hypothetical protein DL762_008829 [Monosporascus cannonballus]